jgi:hypothetical protein
MSRSNTLKVRHRTRDEDSRSLEGKGQWMAARRFSEASELTARFIEGTLGFFPGHYGPFVCDESLPLVPYLAALNRSGFLTTTSQPGFTRGHINKQRAFVDGLVKDPEVVRKIDRLSLVSDLYVLVCPRGNPAGIKLPVTIEDFKASGFSGEAWADVEDDYIFGIDNFKEIYNDALFRDLSTTYYVCIIDLCWGRANHLWEVITRELCVDFAKD